jgi:peptide/nickel transport system permease protein
MWRLAASRVLDAIPTTLLVLTLVFVAMRLLPGDPAVTLLGDHATQAQIEAMRARLGLDVPLWQQYLRFLWKVLTLDFGNSFVNSQPVGAMIALNLPYTIELTIVSTLLGTVAAIPLGVIAATHRGKTSDYVTRLFSLAGFAIPDFYLGALLLITFSLNLGWFPINGGGTDFVDRMYHILLPAVALAFIKAAFVSRLTRSSLLEVMNKDFIRTARAKGGREPRVIYRHGLRNALLPVVTGLGLSILSTLSGSVAIEFIFGRPGIGSMLINAIETRDYPVVQAGVVVFAIFVVAVNLVMDVLYVFIDPRVGATR